MKIKSIKLTSEYEIKNIDSKTFYPGASKAPVYQVEYEETTPTGLKATGTMILDYDATEKVLVFFKELESQLSKKNEGNEEDDEEVNLYDAIYEVCIQAIKDTDAKKTKEVVNQLYNFSMNTGFKISDLMKEVDNKLKNSKDIR